MSKETYMLIINFVAKHHGDNMV
ncbi:rCG22418 [Rattus norvegicus]|uniref:RCG22418 n=1 Tax=Rattus norvegicus TaxID=10116 RepID=A6INM5_RAT|nr:rCG22418 [Rattus norvegicus]